MFSHDENIAYLQRRVTPMMLFALVFFLIVGARLYYLQIKKGDDYTKLATEVFVREEEVVARRGNILDREGRLLADDRIYYEITITPQFVSDKERVAASLSSVLPIDKSLILKKLDEARYEPKFLPVVIAGDVSYEWVAALSEKLSTVYATDATLDLSGVDVRDIPIRRYVEPFLFAHVLGYLREIDKPGLAKAREKFGERISLGDLIGAAGVEESYDLDLRGFDGTLGRVVDARGREIVFNEDVSLLKQRATLAPKPGYTLKTTLDFDAQTAAANALVGKKGAVVALDPNTGAVLALYSTPGYDANRITKNIDKEYWKLINLGEDKFLFNRATQAMYPPASTYKVVGLAAAIHSKKIDPETFSLSCGGGMQFGNRFFKCWKAGGHGRVTPLIGLAQSCDTFFYKMGLLMGVDGLAHYANMFGFGQKTGIDIPFEKAGLVPTAAWKEERRHEKWQESETLSIAIGQGFDLTTQLQNAVSVSLVANGGYRVVPHVGMEILDDKGQVVKKIETEKIKTELAGSDAIKWVQNGMIAVVHGAGTAGRLKLSPYKIAGKTGTAQVIGHDSRARAGVNTEAHALFISYAPYDDPKIAVAVMVEHGRGGSFAAAPIAMAVIDAYLNKLLAVGPPAPGM